MMIKIWLFLIGIFEIIKMIVSVVLRLFSSPRKKYISESLSSTWYGFCDKCGKKGGLHSFEGKEYCATCHAWLSAEKKYDIKQEDE